jgi:hypothetical protein
MGLTIGPPSASDVLLLQELDAFLKSGPETDCELDRRLVLAATLPRFRRALEIIGWSEPLPMPVVENR